VDKYRVTTSTLRLIRPLFQESYYMTFCHMTVPMTLEEAEARKKLIQPRKGTEVTIEKVEEK
jgi:hypothetical protein